MSNARPNKQPAWIQKLLDLGLSYREIQKLALLATRMNDAQFAKYESDKNQPEFGEIIAVLRRQIDRNTFDFTKFLFEAEEELGSNYNSDDNSENEEEK